MRAGRIPGYVSHLQTTLAYLPVRRSSNPINETYCRSEENSQSKSWGSPEFEHRPLFVSFAFNGETTLATFRDLPSLDQQSTVLSAGDNHTEQ